MIIPKFYICKHRFGLTGGRGKDTIKTLIASPARFLFGEKLQVTINGKTHDLPGEMTVLQMIRHLELSESSGIAVAQNATLVSRNHFSDTPVKEGDKLEIIQATSGG